MIQTNTTFEELRPIISELGQIHDGLITFKSFMQRTLLAKLDPPLLKANLDNWAKLE